MTVGRPPTAADVARLAGTSTAVVSYVVNDGPRPVAPATRIRVLEAVEKLGYRPNRAARSLRYGSSATIGLIIPSIRNPFFGVLADAVERAAAERGRLTYVASGGYDNARNGSLARSFDDASVDGLLVVGPKSVQPTRARLLFVHDGPKGSPVIAADPVQAGRLAARHLASCDYDRICVVTEPSRQGFVAATARSAKSTLTRLGEAFDVVEAPYSRNATQAAADIYLRGQRRTVGFLCTTDLHALGVMGALAARGLNVPEQAGVLSIDGTESSERVWPLMTSVAIPAVEIGRVAVSVLCGERDLPEARLAVSLALRGSTAAG